MTATQPLILVSMDHQTQDSRRGPVPTLTLTRNYADAVFRAGGLPWLLPYTQDPNIFDLAIEKADGLLLSGGDFDIDPALFGEQSHPQLGQIVPERTNYEKELLSRAENLKMPILGICGGMQLMNVHRGGTLYQDLGTQYPNALEHQQKEPKDQAGHTLVIQKNTLLSQITKSTNLGVNSTHHQAIKSLGRDLITSATAPDGVVEAIEDPLLSFYLGVQWHPESMPDEPQKAIYQAFIDVCRRQI